MSSKKNRRSTGSGKKFAERRTVNPAQGPEAGRQDAVPSNEGPQHQEQDPARRLGSYEGAGEHARTGNPGHE
jgi:hypothetical protein